MPTNISVARSSFDHHVAASVEGDKTSTCLFTSPLTKSTRITAMSDCSCCDNRSVQSSTPPPTVNDDIPREPGQKSGICCEGDSCTCNDSCIDQLARAICADDDGHIHGSDNDSASNDNKNAQDDVCKCATSTEEENIIKADTPAHVAEHSMPSTTELHSCGLRKRRPCKPVLPQEACGEHKYLALTRQRETLSAFGCICKAMLARGLDSCCMTHGLKGLVTSATSSRASLLKRDRNGSRRTVASSHRHGSTTSLRDSRHSSKESVDSCCDDSCCGDRPVASSIHESANVERRGSVDSCCAASCCGGDGGGNGSRSVSKAPSSCCGLGSCCDEKPSSPPSCEASCCEKDSPDVGKLVLDVEKRDISPGNKLNHATLAVKGMTCTGCENKLIKAIHAIPTVCNVKTSLVLARAEFDFSDPTEDLQVLIGTIEKRTGFSIEEIVSSDSHVVEFTILPTLVEKFCLFDYPDGVKEVARIKKNLVRVAHDPRVIGIRDIISYYSAFSPTLAPLPQNPALAAGKRHLWSLGIRTVISALLTIPVFIMTWAPLPSHQTAYAIASLVLATIVQTAIAGPFYLSAFKSLFFSGVVETDMLIVLSTTTAYIYSVVAFAFEMLDKPLATGGFFETSTLLVTLIMVGQFVSAFARQRAIEAISVRSLQQNTTILVHVDGREEDVDGRLLQYGDTFKVLHDSSIITDGVVIQGQSEVDESMMTGEALPVLKQIGSSVVAGTHNGPGVLFVKVTRLPGDNTISDIADMVDDARFSRAKVQEIVDVVCGWFVPIVLLLTIITFVVWILIGVKVRHQSSGEAAVIAITYAIAVLAVSCPCAIGLAVPMVILIASGVAAQKLGLIFKSATTIETARKIGHVVFDKTGTLTKGELSVTEARILSEDQDVRSVILALVNASKHPVASAIAGYLAWKGVNPSIEVKDVEMKVGKGVLGKWKDEPIAGGNPRWLELENHPDVIPVLANGSTTFCVTYLGQLLAIFALADTIRPEASSVISKLRERNIDVSILSGDHRAAVERVALSLGIPLTNVKAGCLPTDKQAYLRELSKKGNRVLFCGDGTNDAIALAQADIGVHMSSASPTSNSGSGIAASSAADVVLIRATLNGILALFALSRAVHQRIVLNFAWSAVYNLVAILFAAGAFVGARIAPAYAGLGELVSVLPVVVVAVQLKWFNGGRD
ncbi:heavy metal translocatin [Panus rudis PR-1116 ss-1]|nr:heavy metal translocatin [Panus rudis PR-1116 ss-1]